MINVESITNRWLTTLELAKVFNTEEILRHKTEDYQVLKGIGNGDLFYSGRNNHIWVQDLFMALTNKKFIVGGQGKAHPDLYMSEGKAQYRVEVKAFDKKDKIRVSPSKFFASNGGMTELKNLETKKEQSDLVLSHYIDDYYLLTQTTKKALSRMSVISNLQFYLIKKADMLPLLKDDGRVPISIIDLSEEI
tara:strand:+ start:458 stop:1033 length:576 start_codon:yes stop_codon:yes gene_type:complete